MRTRIVCVILLGVLLGGCSASTATVDLISQGRRGLALAAEAQQVAYQREKAAYEAQLTALDEAFDEDVQQVASGAVADVEFTADWVVQARQGYTAARSLVETQAQAAAEAYATDVDNLAAADEALELAATLSAMQWSVTEQIREQYLALQDAVLSSLTEGSTSDE